MGRWLHKPVLRELVKRLFRCVLLACLWFKWLTWSSVATTLTFDPPESFVGEPAGYLPDAYGDHVQQSLQDGFVYGDAGGWTPDITVRWGTRRFSLKDWQQPGLFGIQPIQANLNGAPNETAVRALNADTGADQTLEVVLSGSDVAWPQLRGFDLLGTGARTPTIVSVAVTDNQLTTLFVTNAVVLPANDRLRFRFPQGLIAAELRLVISLGRSQELIALDSVEFGQVEATPSPWVFEIPRVMPWTGPCPDRPTLLNLEFDRQGRAVLGWAEGNGCGGGGSGWWARQTATGTWETQRLLADEIYKSTSAFTLNSEGRPFFFHHRMVCCDADVYTIRTDLEQAPQGPGSIVQYQGRNLEPKLSADGRAATIPSWVSHQRIRGVPIRLNGAPVTLPLSGLDGNLVYRQGPAGQHHLIYNEDNGHLHYNAGSTNSDRVILLSYRYSRALALAVDSSNAVHVASVHGTGGGGFQSIGNLNYLYSSDGTQWVTNDLGISNVGNVAIALDSQQRAVIAFTRNFEELWLVRQSATGWSAPERIRERLGLAAYNAYRDLQLAVDSNDVPHIATYDELTRSIVVTHPGNASIPGNLRVQISSNADVLPVGKEVFVTAMVKNIGVRTMSDAQLMVSVSPEALVRATEPPAYRTRANRYQFELGSIQSQEERLIRFRMTSLDPAQLRFSAQVGSETSEADPTDNTVEVVGPEFRSDTCRPGVLGALLWLGGDGNTLATDLISGTPLATAGQVRYDSGIFGRAFQFGGSVAGNNGGGGILYGPEFGTRTQLDGSFSVHAWVRSTNAAAGSMTIVDYTRAAGRSPGGEPTERVTLRLNQGKPIWVVAGAGSVNWSGDAITSQELNLADGRWHHIAGVRDLAGNELRLYVDGQRVGSIPLTAVGRGAISSSNNGVTVGAAIQPYVDTWSDTFEGHIDDVIVMEKALSDDDMATLHRAGIDPECEAPILTPQQLPQAIVGDPWSAFVRSPNLALGWWLTADTSNLPGDFCFTRDGELRGISTQAGQFAVPFQFTDGVVTQRLTRTVRVTSSKPPAGLLAHWPMEESVTDVFGRHPTQSNPKATHLAGKIGLGIQTPYEPGSGPDLLHSAADGWIGGGRPGTLVGWFRWDPATSASSGSQPVGAWLSLLSPQAFEGIHLMQRFSDGRLAVHAGPPDGRATQSSGVPIVPGRWYHVAFGINNRSASVRLDGELVIETTLPFAAPAMTRLVAGGIGNGRWFAGALDEVSVFDRVLSSEEIDSLRGLGIPQKNEETIGGEFPLAVLAGAPQLLMAREGDPIRQALGSYFCGRPQQFELVEGALPLGLELRATGELAGIPLESGQWDFVVEAQADHSRAKMALSLRVEGIAPRFYVQPVDGDVVFGGRARLFVVASPRAQLQWQFQGKALHGENGPSLVIPDFTAAQAGTYDCVATTSGGVTTSEKASLRLIGLPAEQEGPQVQDRGIGTDGVFRMTLSTVPGRAYLLRRARGDSLDGATIEWDIIGRLVATSASSAFEDASFLRAERRFYQIVEEPPPPQAPYSTTDATRLIPLDTAGNPRPGFAPADLPDGGVAPFEFRPAGSALPAGHGLRVRFPLGARPVSASNGSVFRASEAVVEFGPESPWQFDAPIQARSAEGLDIPAGPISVATIERLAGLAPGAGVPIRLFGRFPLLLTSGQFDGNVLRGARLRYTPKAGAPEIPLPMDSADLPDFDLPLGNREPMRLAYHGSFDLPDFTGIPATVTIPARRPLWLELHSDGQVRLGGRVEVSFREGPRFAAEFAVEDPRYFLRLEAAHLRLPPILPADSLLPAPAVSDTLTDGALDQSTIALTNALIAHRAFANLVAAEGGPGVTPTHPTPPHPELDATFAFWEAVTRSWAASTLPESWHAALQRVRANAAASQDPETILKSVAMLNAVLRDRPDADTAEIRDAVAEARAAVPRVIESSPLDVTPGRAKEIVRLGVAAAARVQAGGADDSQIQAVVGDYLIRFIGGYVSNGLGARPGIFEAPAESPIRRLGRYEATLSLATLLEFHVCAQQLGVDGRLRALPYAEGLMQLARQLWIDLSIRMNQALGQQERRTYYFLLPEMAELVRLHQSGIYTGEDWDLPTPRLFQSYLDQVFAGLPVQQGADEVYGQRVNQLRDDAARFASLLRDLPPGAVMPPDAVRRNYTQLGERLTQLFRLLGSQSLFPVPELLARLQAHLIHEELRLRYSLEPDNASLQSQLDVTVDRLIERAVPLEDWPALILSAEACLEMAARFDNADASSSKARGRHAQLRNAARLLSACKSVNVTQWNALLSNRPPDASHLAADLWLPAGFTVEDVSGEVEYKARARRLRGAVAGKFRFPNLDARLQLLNASIDSGGAMDLSVAGTMELPPSSGSPGTLTIPRRRPWHVAIDRQRHVTLEGGAQLRLRSGATFEGFISLSDPIYQVGVSASGLRFEMANHLGITIPVPDPQRFSQLPATLEAPLNHYLGHLAATLEPLSSVADLPNLPELGTPPDFNESVVTLNADSVRAAASGLILLSNSPVSFGFSSLTLARDAFSTILSNANRELGRGARELGESRRTHQRAINDAQTTLRHPSRQLLAECFCQQVDSLEHVVGQVAGFLDLQQRGVFAGTPVPFADQPALVRSFRETSDAMRQLLQDNGLEQDPGVAEHAVSCALRLERLSERIGMPFDTGARAESAAAAVRVRTRLMQRLGLHPDGTVQDSALLRNLPLADQRRLGTQILQWTDLIQRLGEETPFIEELQVQLYLARRHHLLSTIRRLLNDRSQPPVLIEARYVDEIVPEILSLDQLGQRTVPGGRVEVLEQLDGNQISQTLAQDQEEWVRLAGQATARLASRLSADQGSDATLYRQYTQAKKKKAEHWRRLLSEYERRRSTGRDTPVVRQLEADMGCLARHEFGLLETRVLTPRFQLQLADGLEVLDEALSLARVLERFQFPEIPDTSLNAQVLARFTAEVLPRFQVQLTALAQARKAWWIAHRATSLLQEGWKDKLETDRTALDRALKTASRNTLETTATLVRELLISVQTAPHTFDVPLPGNLIVRQVAGQLLYNHSESRLEGTVSGVLEFPEIGAGATFSLHQLKLATDGSFILDASADTPVPIGDNTRFTGELHAAGRKRLTPDFDGTLTLAGRGQLTFDGGQTLGARLEYTQVIENNRPRWILSFDVNAAGVQRLGQDAVIFAANGGLTAGNAAPGVNLRLGGKAGFWRKNRNQPLPNEDSQVTPELFEVLVDDVQFELSDSPGQAALSIQRGTLRLPQVFYAADLPPGVRCEPVADSHPGPSVSITPERPLVVSIPKTNGELGRPSLTGGIRFARIGFGVPGLPDLAAAICDAELRFNADGPELLVRDGRLNIPFPTDSLALRLSSTRFTLDGLPIGTLSLVEPFTVIDAGGFEVTLLGSLPGQQPARRFRFPADYTVGEQSACQGTSLELFALPPPKAHLRGLRLRGGLEISLPASLVLAEGGAGGRDGVPPANAAEPSVGATVCGELTLTPTDGTPEIDLQLTRFGISTSPGVSWRLGPSGIRVIEPSISLENPASLLKFDPNLPAQLRLAGTLDVNGQFLLTLNNARFSFETPKALPRFVVDGLSYQQGAKSLLGRLPVQLTAASLRFQNPGLSLPELFQPANVRLTVSARVQVPPPDPTANPPVVPVLVGALERVAIEFDPQTGLPKAPSLDAVELGLATDALKLPPLDAIGGRARLGGLQGESLDSIYISARLSGKLQTTQITLQGVFTWQGPLGVCLDANAGPVGIPIGVTGFLITGASGGVSLLNGNGDPCDFQSYFVTGPGGFLQLRSTGLPGAPMTWAELRSTAERMVALARSTAANQPQPSLLNVDSNLAQDTRGNARPHAPSSDLGTIGCPGDCPPATINLFCQPHPDPITFSNRVILKFSSIDESTLNAIGVTRSTFQPNATPATVAAAVAERLILRIRALTPAPNLPGFEALAQGLESVLQGAASAISTSLQAALSSQGAMATADAIYERIRLEAYKGIGCPDLTMAVAGRVSYTGLSAFAYVEGKGVASTAGSLGVIGTVNVLGIPFGQAKLFVSGTDDQGLPNPSMCGQVRVAVGPLELGEVDAALECPGCVTSLLGVYPDLLRALGEPVARQVLSRAAPQLELGSRPLQNILADLASRSPEEQFGIASRIFDALLQLRPQDLPANLIDTVINALGARVEQVQPSLTLCGAVQPRLFGIALGQDPLVGLQARVTRQGFSGTFGFSPAAAAYPFAAILPALDTATLSVNYAVPDPLQILFAGLGGAFGSPEATAELIRDSVNNALNRTTYAASYELHPFGFNMLSVAGRFIEPDLLNHPSLRGSDWRTPESRGLPGRVEVLVEAARRHVLGDAVGWSGIGDGFLSLYEDSSPQRNQLNSYAATLRRPITLRQDYFPHGGFVGAGVLTLPKLLAESPNAWISLLRQVIQDPNLPAKATAAGTLINEHILASTNTGELAFYVPTLNPPRFLTHPADSMERARILTEMNQRARLGSEVASWSAAELQALFPLEVAFMKGRLGTEGFNRTILGIPMGSAEIDISRTSAVVRVTPPDNSWLASMVRGAQGGASTLNIDFSRPPSVSITNAFVSLRERIPTLSANQLVAELQTALAQKLPRVGIDREVGLPPIPEVLSRLIAAEGTLRFQAFSPGYDPTAAGNSPAALSRREGGLVLSGALQASLTDPVLGTHVDLMRLPSAELALFPDTSNPLAPPRLAGMVSNLSASVLGLFPIDQGIARFDTASATPFEFNGRMNPANLGPFRLEPRLNTPGAVTLRAVSIGQGVGASLELDPMRLLLPGVGVNRSLLELHGSAGLGTRFTLATHTDWSAAATLAATGTLRGFAGPLEVLRASSSSDTRFGVSGIGLGQWRVSAVLPSPGTWSILVLPTLSLGNRMGIPLTPSTTAQVSFAVDTDGRFELDLRLDTAPALPGLPGFQGPIHAVVNNSGLLLSGTLANGGRSEVRVFTDGRITTAAEVHLGPLEFRLLNGHRLARFASLQDGAVAASTQGELWSVPAGAVLSVWTDASGVPKQFQLPAFTYNAGTGALAVQPTETASGASTVTATPSRIVGRHQPSTHDGPLGSLRIGRYELSRLDRVNFQATSATEFALEIQGQLAVPGLGALSLRTRIGSEAFSLEVVPPPAPLVFAGLSFGEIRLQTDGPRFHPASVPDLSFSGTLLNLPSPLNNLRMQGPINPDGWHQLNAGNALETLMGNFPLKRLTASVQPRDVSADYGAAVRSHSPRAWSHLCL